MFQTAAAGNFHANHRQAPDIVVGKYRCKFLRVINRIKFGASNNRDAVFHEVTVKTRPGECRTIGSEEQIRTIEE